MPATMRDANPFKTKTGETSDIVEITLGIPSKDLSEIDRLVRELGLGGRAEFFAAAYHLLRYAADKTGDGTTLALVDEQDNIKTRIRL